MAFIVGIIGLVIFGFVVATVWGGRDAVRQYRSSLQVPEEVHQMGVDSVKQGNIKAAVLRFQHASEMGHAGSAFNMGLLYANAKPEQNMAEAFKWFKLAADRGLAQGQLNVGDLYLKGVGVEKDLTKAYHYFRLGADQGFEPAIDQAREFESALEYESRHLRIPEEEWAERRWAVTRYRADSVRPTG